MALILQVPLCTISRIEKVGGVTSSSKAIDGRNPYGLELYCKDLRILRFAMKHENHQRRSLYEKLHELCFPVSNKQVILITCILKRIFVITHHIKFR